MMLSVRKRECCFVLSCAIYSFRVSEEACPWGKVGKVNIRSVVTSYFPLIESSTNPIRMLCPKHDLSCKKSGYGYTFG